MAKALTNPFSLSVYEGAWAGILGDNGSGKSTFLKTILGQIPPKSGEISLFSKPSGHYKINRKIGYIPQARQIDTPDRLTAFELLKASLTPYRLGLPFYRKKNISKIKDYVNLVGANHYIHSPFQQLSGGQKKRIYLAQALINEPKLLLLDEPLADLDLKAKHHFIHCLKQVHQQIPLTVLIITHEMNEMHSYLSDFIHFHNHDVVMTPNYPFKKAFEDHCHHV